MGILTVTMRHHNLSKCPKTDMRHHLIRVYLRSFGEVIRDSQFAYLRFAPVVVLLLVWAGFLPSGGTLGGLGNATP